LLPADINPFKPLTRLWRNQHHDHFTQLWIQMKALNKIFGSLFMLVGAPLVSIGEALMKIVSDAA